MDLVVSAVFPLFALIFCGYLSARRGLLGPAATDSLNRYVVWLALPALLFQALAGANLRDLGEWRFVLAFGGGMMATFAVSLLLDRRAGRRLADRAIDGLDAAYANNGFMGIPLALAVFGNAALPAALLSALLTVCVVFSVAIVLIEVDLQAAATWHAVLRKVGLSLLRNPLLLSPLLGVAVAAAGLTLPLAVTRFTALLGASASPCALVTIGLFLAQNRERSRWPVVARLVGLKLLLQPALTAVLAFGVFRMPPLWSHTALLLSALPTGTGPFMLAKLYDRDAAPTAAAILVSTLLSVVTISLLVAVFGRL